jgi:hypothetical protein
MQSAAGADNASQISAFISSSRAETKAEPRQPALRRLLSTLPPRALNRCLPACDTVVCARGACFRPLPHAARPSAFRALHREGLF